MKKTIMVTMIICVLSVFVASFAIAESLPPYAKSILESWGASSAEELRVNMINYWASLPHASSDTHPDFPGYQVKITFGQTTEELINAPESWNLAIVSSREVNLQKVADAGLLPEQPHYPNSGTVVDYRFLPEKAKNCIPLPLAPERIYEIYCYSYDVETEEAVFLLCKQNREKQDGYKLLPSPVEFAIGILSRRSEVDARSVLGGLHHEVYRPVDELIANPHNWDTAVLADEYIMMRPKNHDMSFLNDLGITIDGPHPQPDLNEHLKQLVKAGLLYDFSQDEYFSQYAGMITLDGKMVAVSLGLRYPELRHPLYVVNAQSPLLEQALEYIKYRAKSAEWAYENISSNGEWYNRNEMDW